MSLRRSRAREILREKILRDLRIGRLVIWHFQVYVNNFENEVCRERKAEREGIMMALRLNGHTSSHA